LFQALAYRTKGLSFSIVVVAAKHFLAFWRVDSLPQYFLDEVDKSSGAPNAIGKKLAKKYASKQKYILENAVWHKPEIFTELFASDVRYFATAIDVFEKGLQAKKKVRQSINTKNFTKILKDMRQFFPSSAPIKTVRAFYSMIYGPWDDSSVLRPSQRYDDRATLGSAEITDLIPSKISKFKDFVENHSVQLKRDQENIDDFFAKYDEALDAVDKDFRVKNGIFFTDLDLSKFAMWLVKKNIPNLGKNYLVIDPACGSGNLVTNWRSPLEIRHKVVSEIEPELLFAIEQRMKGDQWHEGKFTVVPKVSENKGLNFLEYSAEEYLEILKSYLAEKDQKPDKPLAFLCNPPYRSDDDQAAESISYEVDANITEVVGKDASSDRYLCFLAQMKLICDYAGDSGLPEDSLLLLFTQTSWLTQRPLVQKIRQELFGSFEDIGGFLINGAEFFEGVGKFPIAFTMWRYKGKAAGLNPDRPISLVDLCNLKQKDLATINWENPDILNNQCDAILKAGPTQLLGLTNTKFSGKWAGTSRRNLYRTLSDDEKKDTSTTHLGLPSGDLRHKMKTTFGYSKGTDVAFMLNLTPCRTFLKDTEKDKIWFHLDSRFMKTRTARCMSGIPDRGYCASSPEIAFSLFLWYSMSRTFGALGYPMWANMEEMWVPEIPEKYRAIVSQYIYSIAFAENDCLQVTFPLNNPVRGAPEVVSKNQMSPLDKDTFWSKHLAPHFGGDASPSVKDLIKVTNKIFATWKARFNPKKAITPNYSRPYLLSENSKLTVGAGLVQIREHAEETNDTELLGLLEKLAAYLRVVKSEFLAFLVAKNGLNYFEQKKQSVKTIEWKPGKQTWFERVLEKRKSLTGLVVSKLSNDENLGAVKLAKIIYIADQDCDLGLNANYVKDVAGPVDSKLLYNSKIGLFPNGKSSDLGKITEIVFKRNGKHFRFMRITPSEKTNDWAKRAPIAFGRRISAIERLIKLFRPLTTEHSEAVATLYACWNDILLLKRSPTDEEIVRRFYQWDKGKKKFSKEDLFKTLKWMKVKGLQPKGRGRLSEEKRQKDSDKVPF
ncbi:MAG: hypothetical protein AB7P04_02030, partial [Bacteriovoracia bacterium]